MKKSLCKSSSTIEIMIRNLQDNFPSPVERPNYKPFSWKLDGGGRDLIFSLLNKHDIKLMVEVGVFFGGSVLQWLENKHDLTVIGIDPWIVPQETIIQTWNNRFLYGIQNLQMGDLSNEEFLEQILRPDALYESVISNIWDYRDRFVPVRDGSPGALHKLSSLGIAPELVYFDSDKELADISVCNDLWPQAMICGDDWMWSDSSKPDIFPVQVAVKKFAAERGMRVISSEATWYLEPIKSD